MDKNTYETYEFLPANGNESAHDQFFVVQDDGSFLLNRQVQYVAQVQDVKEALEDVQQPCTVYGVSPQQFFVDVDNSTELISVADQFILPDGDNSLYTNSYLLQPSASTTTTDQMQEDVIVDQYKQPNTQDVDMDVVTHNSKQGNNFTEITLSDEQYQTLEQKGWILLESNDKIFVLNTLGLHDITNNDKLIQKLRNEIQNDNNITGNNSGTLKIESISSQFPNMVTEPLTSHQELEFMIDADHQQNDDMKCMQIYANENKETIQQLATTMTNDNEINCENLEPPPELVVPELLEQPIQQTTQAYYDKDTRSIRIKTKFNFKDFPDKIPLGKCANGKRLVAKVVKRQSNNDFATIKPNEDVVVKQIAGSEHYNTTGLHEVDFVNLIQAMLRSGPRYNEGDIAAADTVISQLIQVPNLKLSFFGENLIVTKASNNKDENGKIYNSSKVTLITGRVKEKEGREGEFGFEHVPNLLHTIKLKADKQNASQSDEAFTCFEEKEAKENFTVYHVHISETKCTDNVIRVSVTLNKRQLPVNLVFDMKKRYPTTVFGCSSCAVLFKSEEALKEHQEKEKKCMETGENKVKIEESDQSNNDDDVIVMKTGQETIFSCGQCNVTFTKLSNIQRHMKTHQGTTQEILQTNRVPDQETQPQPKKQPVKVFKCKMCPSTYFHSASLSKHIVTRHIKVKSK